MTQLERQGSRRRLAIIGGGQAAKALLMAIAERLYCGRGRWHSAEILVFERSREFGTGLAWSRGQVLPEHLSSLASDQPRGDFGDHQQVQFSRCAALLEELGAHPRMLPGCEVVHLARDGAGWRLVTQDGQCFTADAVVLATGHARGRETRPPGALWPWPASALQRVVSEGQDVSVLVLGTSLTGIDTALTIGLAAGEFEELPSDPRGVGDTERAANTPGRLRYRLRRAVRVILASRSGALPAVWGSAPRPWPELERPFAEALDGLTRRHGRLLLAEAFDALAALSAALDAELAGVDRPGLSLRRRIRRLQALQRLRARDPQRTLRADLARAEGAGGRTELPWQRALLAMLPALSEAFPGLNAQDHALFERHLRGPLYRHAMPMGQPTARRLLAMMEAGVLEVRRLDAHAVHREAHGWAAVDCDGRRLTANHVVDALGQEGDPTAWAPAWLEHALRDGLLRRATRAADDGGGGEQPCDGLDVDPRTRRVRAATPQLPLYAMGVLTLGLFLDAQAIGHLIRDAECIVADLDRLDEPPAGWYPVQTQHVAAVGRDF